MSVVSDSKVDLDDLDEHSAWGERQRDDCETEKEVALRFAGSDGVFTAWKAVSPGMEVFDGRGRTHLSARMAWGEDEGEG